MASMRVVSMGCALALALTVGPGRSLAGAQDGGVAIETVAAPEADAGQPEVLPPPSDVSTAPAVVEPSAADPGAEPAGAAALEVGPEQAQLPSVPPPAGPIEVTVHGQKSEAQELRESAESVTVVELKQAKKRSADLGEIMARTFGVTARQTGGLGSETRFALNGLQNDQVRFFLDGVPLEFMYPFGIASVPVNLLERVEIYRGVVPVRLGVDALGGAVNLVTDQSYQTRAAASYKVGSWGTHRATLSARYRHEPTGFVVGVESFLDKADNDYPIHVEIADTRGKLRPVEVKRFHDNYAAYGVSAETGFVDTRWAKRFLVRGYYSEYWKQLQHNAVMTQPYGKVHYGESVAGVMLRYDQDLLPNLKLELVANYAYRVIDFTDKSKWVYNWYGDQVRERVTAGEIDAKPTDQTQWQDSFFGRAVVSWTLAPTHVIRASITPTRPDRTGKERMLSNFATRDPMRAKRQMFTLVSGLEYEFNALKRPGLGAVEGESLNSSDHALQNVVFAKHYLYSVDAEEPLVGGGRRERDKSVQVVGGGDGLRLVITDWLIAKASYEYAVFLPRVDQVFGNGVLIVSNLELNPERSHNGNLGARMEVKGTPAGRFMLDVNAFIRQTQDQIVLIPTDRYSKWQNVFNARNPGVEGAWEWESPGRYVGVDGSLTYTDLRNDSDKGPFAAFDGDRVPARPWLYGSWGAHLLFSKLLAKRDELEPYYVGRYVHEFYRSWEGQGDPRFKQVVPMQVTHTLGVTYSNGHRLGRYSFNFEAQNLGDAQVFDFFGVQRPGRSYYGKLTAELR
jgi:vitamin B12 transporter